MPKKKSLTDDLSKEDARKIALLAFETDEDLFVKTESCYVEIRVQKEAQVLQIQDNGSMMLFKKFDDTFYHPIPKCFQIVQLIEKMGYELTEVK